ncbi:hypothetical protein QBC41DRAFT_307832 [Cercophora samala]|uniref:2EXR domain-containing protein n=1 Tax=Cercophora samala TaxID=330535 RepID=A0AA40D212_9PEZI|nr:hypothetical protein QBC41DRAFT_307832 [Cercophora samala]
MDDTTSSQIKRWKDRLPVEIRLKIYRATWEPSIVSLHYAPDGSTKSGQHPMTLSLNFEAREETLKHYIKWSFSSGYNHGAGEYDSQGYINPSIDILFLDSPVGRDRSWVISLGPIAPASLNVALGLHLNRRLVAKLLKASNILPAIRTIDFWVTNQHSFQLNQPQVPVTARYRLYRTTVRSIPRTMGANYNTYSWRPHPIDGFKCQKTDCQNSTAGWKWTYLGKALNSASGTFQQVEWGSEPVPGSEMTMRVSSFGGPQCGYTPEALAAQGAVLFDAGPESVYREQDHEWSIVQVIDPDISMLHIVPLAQRHRDRFNVLEKEHRHYEDDRTFNHFVATLTGEVDWNKIPACEFEWLLSRRYRLEPQILFPVANDELHGVCQPGFLVNERCEKPGLGNEIFFPTASMNVALVYPELFPEMESLNILSEEESKKGPILHAVVGDAGAKGKRQHLKKVWHSCQ